ncbi:hypothetical protein PP175_25420 (plasmid) [Aneurinibacillus sp. Ricciae_BoGa-3]|uniref:hypothetical protein n=1 Tax=Aneurinibacillus sp. Ricciae_BoGa-3 TaxID=3022697 RepID=UPI0023425B21|nr:hypothetical protein [Aneurinibacillus sp. Ricciae_BoGa-3]WCK57410.1 hypothetical protein PP175_25420 [Aneurinibacillus sp. Ricciae_BoGa-3]
MAAPGIEEKAGIYTEEQVKKHGDNHHLEDTEIVEIPDVEEWSEEQIISCQNLIKEDVTKLEEMENTVIKYEELVREARSSIDRNNDTIAELKWLLLIQEKLKQTNRIS